MNTKGFVSALAALMLMAVSPLVLADAAVDTSAAAGFVPDSAWQETCIAAPYDYQYQDEQKSIAINKFNENGITYFVADIQLADASLIGAALSGGQPFGPLEGVSAMAQRAGAVLAINGDDYGVHKYGVIIRNGELLRAATTTRNMLIVDANGDMTVMGDHSSDNPQTLADQLMGQGVLQTYEFGPALVSDGAALDFSSKFDLISTNPSRREPRTAIGQIDTLHYIVIVADGRQDGYSVGMTLPELQQLFIDYGARTALNLDGGGSAELWFNGSILNKPAGGGERSISDIIFF